MKQSLNERVLRNLMTEREMAIAAGNKERLDELTHAIVIHLNMMQKEKKDETKS